ncbi:MAG: hypothetical protein SOZ00_01195 [Tidjanibacter sp.]|nr:hypothetical protein [Tidjanibacter sp.]
MAKKKTTTQNLEGYLENTTLELGKELIDDIRCNVNAWANNISNQPFDDLGDEMEIGAVDMVYLYRAKLTTQFDNRTIKRGSKPFIGQAVPPFVNNDPKGEDIWAYNLKTTQKFISDSVDFFTIDHSQSVDPCKSCASTGSTTCPTCKGRKSFTCTACNGKGEVPNYAVCPSCNGKKQVTVYTQENAVVGYRDGKQVYGLKRVAHQRSCSYCGGAGQVRRGFKACSSCHGKGHLVCSTCQGRGVVVCPVCEGHKELLNYLYIEQNLECVERQRFVVEMPDADFTEALKLLTEKDFERVELFEANDGKLSNDFTCVPIVGNVLEDMVDSLHSMVGSNRHLLFEQLSVSRTFMLKVDYLFDGEPFRLHIVANGGVVALHSPISNYTDGLLVSAKRKARRRNLFAANRLFEQIYDITENEAFWDMSSSVAGKMHADMKYGSNLALACCAVLLFPLVGYYLNNFSFVAPWVNLPEAVNSWTWGCLPYLYTATAVVGGYLFSRLNWGYVYEKVPTFILRMLLGVVLGIAGVVVSSALLCVAHFLILPTVWETLGQIILLPWNLLTIILGILF